MIPSLRRPYFTQIKIYSILCLSISLFWTAITASSENSGPDPYGGGCVNHGYTILSTNYGPSTGGASFGAAVFTVNICAGDIPPLSPYWPNPEIDFAEGTWWCAGGAISGHFEYYWEHPIHLISWGAYYTNTTVHVTTTALPDCPYGCSDTGPPCPTCFYTFELATITIRAWGEGDADYDGVCNCQEVRDSTDPGDSNSVAPVLLGYWRFNNTNNWIGEDGQWPMVNTNFSAGSSWSQYALSSDGSAGKKLIYRPDETNDCFANINLRRGSIRFWFSPSWSSATTNSGTGPGNDGRLIEVGNSSIDWWALIFDAAGTNISFISTPTTNFTGVINWGSNEWHQVVLTYGPDVTKLYVDGEPIVTNGLGISHYPGAGIRNAGFSVGGDRNGDFTMNGKLDELETFNCQLSALEIAAHYQAIGRLDSDGDGLPDIKEFYLGTDPNNPDSNGNGIPDGWEFEHGANPANPVSAMAFQIMITRPTDVSKIP